MIRKPYAAGGFYPLHKEVLIKTIEECFKNKEFGPGSLPNGFKGDYAFGGIAPHAGYIYSGPCAAWLYKYLKEYAKPETVVILGTNHTGLGDKITTLVTYKWETPLGIVNTDLEFGKLLIKEVAVEDFLAMQYEHSIEVQLPFLQYIYGNSFKLVPIILKDMDLEEVRELAKVIYEISLELNRKILVIASSDFTHHGEYYGYVLFTENVNENVKELDLKYIRAIEELNTKKFFELLEKYNGTVCGYLAIGTLIEYTKLIGGKLKLLKYYTSADITKDESLIVGYASVIGIKSKIPL